MSNTVSDDFEISFSLGSLSEIVSSEPMLSWFRLSDGVFDARVGAHSLYAPPPGGVDYYVARLWEDLVRVEPFAVEVVPARLADLIADPPTWQKAVDQLLERSPDASRTGGTLAWWARRVVDSSYLTDGPTLRFIRVDTNVRIIRTVDRERSVAVVAAQQFASEMSAFDRRLIAAMATRLDELDNMRLIPPSELEQVRFDHMRRANYRFQTLSHHVPTDWGAVLHALQQLGFL